MCALICVSEKETDQLTASTAILVLLAVMKASSILPCIIFIVHRSDHTHIATRISLHKIWTRTTIRLTLQPQLDILYLQRLLHYADVRDLLVCRCWGFILLSVTSFKLLMSPCQGLQITTSNLLHYLHLFFFIYSYFLSTFPHFFTRRVGKSFLLRNIRFFCLCKSSANPWLTVRQSLPASILNVTPKISM